MRDSIESVVDAWLGHFKPPLGASDDQRRELVRELLIVMSTPDQAERDQEFIDRACAAVRRAVEGGADPRNLFEHWMNASTLPFWRQKVIQWFMAYVYQAGFKRGQGAKPTDRERVGGL